MKLRRLLSLALTILSALPLGSVYAADLGGAGGSVQPIAAPKPVINSSANSSNAAASVKPRIEHSVNRYAHGNQTMTGSRLQHQPVVIHHATPIPRHSQAHHTIHHVVLTGKSERAARVGAHTNKAFVHAHLVPRHLQHHKDASNSSGGGGGGGYNGANGDSGGGGESVGPISTSGVNIPIATAAQARTFWNAVHTDFDRWDVAKDGRLTQSEIKHVLANPAVKGNKAAALSAMLVTMKDQPAQAGTSRASRYWSLEGLGKLVAAAEQSNKGRLINRFAQHSQMLSQSEKQTENMPLFGSAGAPNLADLVKGPTDNHAFLATAAGLAHLRPEILRSMLQPDGKGSFLVHFPNTAPQAVRLSQGEMAELASNGRGVLWLDVLRKAHERLVDSGAFNSAAAADGKGALEFLGLVDQIDAAQAIPLLTHHEARVFDLQTGAAEAEKLKSDLQSALADKRLALLSTGTSTAVVLGYDGTKDAVEVWQPQLAGLASSAKLTDKQQSTELLPMSELSKKFATAYIESDKHTDRSYYQILAGAKRNESAAALASSDTAEDASISELLEQGVALAENADGESVKTTELTLKNGKKVVEFEIGDGSALIAHESHVRVLTKICQVEVAPNASAYVLNLDGATAIYNLSDMHSGEVLVKVGKEKKSLHVPLGQLILLVDDAKADFEDANPDNKILHRNVVSLGVIGDVAAFKAEFSFTSLLDNASGFQELCNSDKLVDKKIVKRLIKTAAIMLTLRPPFDEPVPAPQETATGSEGKVTTKAEAK